MTNYHVINYNVHNLSNNYTIDQESISIFRQKRVLFKIQTTHSKKWMCVQTQTKTIHLTTRDSIFKSWIDMYVIL